MIKELYITLTTQDNEVKESLDKLLIQLEAQKWIKINSCREERLNYNGNINKIQIVDIDYLSCYI